MSNFKKYNRLQNRHTRIPGSVSMQNDKKNRVTIYDIAKILGISASTVNRAINGDPRVNHKTQKLVLETAKSIGYKANRVASGLTRNSIRIGVLINDTIPEYRDMVVKGVEKAFRDLADFNIEGHIHIVKNLNDPARDVENRDAIIQKLDELIEGGSDAIVFSPSSEYGYEVILEKARQHQVKIATFLTDIANQEDRIFSVRPDGSMVGRIAADLFNLVGLKSGDEIAIFTCNRLTKIFDENINGFIERNKTRKLNLVGIIENCENPDLAYRNTELLIKKYPNIKGIYVNSINSVAVCKKLVDMGYQEKIKLITVDLLSEIAEYIRTGVISATIFQDPVGLGEKAVHAMYGYIAEQKEVASNIFVSPKIIVSSNITDYLK